MSVGNKIIYLEHGLLGQGTFGSVHLIINYKDPDNPRFEAIKSFNKKAAYQHEKNINKLILLSHENNKKFIVQMLRFDDSQKSLFLEYINGCDIFDFSEKFFNQNKKYSVDIILYVFRGIFDSINALHNSGVIHLDVKPNNLLIDLNMNIKIADFSLATKVGEKCLGFRNNIGVFMPPECLKSFHARTSIDIYSAAASMIVILSLDTEYELQCKAENGYISSDYIKTLIHHQVRSMSKFEDRQLIHLGDFLIKALDIQASKRPTFYDSLMMKNDMKSFGDAESFLQCNLAKEVLSYYMELARMDRKVSKEIENLNSIKEQMNHRGDFKYKQAKSKIKSLKSENLKLDGENNGLRKENEQLKELLNFYQKKENELMMKEPESGTKDSPNHEGALHKDELQLQKHIVQDLSETQQAFEEASEEIQSVHPLQLCNVLLENEDETVSAEGPSNLQHYFSKMIWVKSNKGKMAIKYNECVATYNSTYPKKAVNPPVTTTYKCRRTHVKGGSICKTKILIYTDVNNIQTLKEFEYKPNLKID